MDDTDVDYNEVVKSVKTLRGFAEQDAVLDLPDTTPPHPDEIRMTWLSTHSIFRVTRNNNIKIKVSAKPNGINTENMFRDYIDMLMEQGAK